MDLPKDHASILELLRYRFLSGMRCVAIGEGESEAYVWDDRKVVPITPGAGVDAAVVDGRIYDAETARSQLNAAFEAVAPQGAVYFLLPADSELEEVIADLDALLYCGWQIHAAGGFSFFPGPALPAERSALRIVMLVRPDYDPIAHARELLTAGRISQAYEVLGNVPAALIDQDEARGMLSAEKQLVLLAWDRHLDAHGRLNRFASAHYAFYEATTYLPHLHSAYQAAALFWQRIGRPDMARRQLASVLHATPDAATRELFDSIPAERVDIPSEAEAPEWSGKPMRILYLMHPNSDYGADVLFDGLCRLLGPENIVDYPWKETLHGGDPALAWGYPCVFEWPGTAHDLASLIAHMKAHPFDAILYSDNFHKLPKEDLEQILAVAGDTPAFITDTWDQCGDYREAIEQHLGRAAAGQFKREMLAGAPYSAHTWSLPFAYPDGLVPASVDYDGKQGLFWAGKLQFGARRLSLEYLRDTIGLDLLASYPPDEYAKRIDAALAGLSFFGNGFDTVRFWELPAHGTLLIGEKPPIALPHPFVDGEHALLFEHLGELEERLTWFAAHPDQARDLARRGHEHFRRYHTGTARARELLARIEAQGSAQRRRR